MNLLRTCLYSLLVLCGDKAGVAVHVASSRHERQGKHETTREIWGNKFRPQTSTQTRAHVLLKKEAGRRPASKRQDKHETTREIWGGNKSRPQRLTQTPAHNTRARVGVLGWGLDLLSRVFLWLSLYYFMSPWLSHACLVFLKLAFGQLHFLRTHLLMSVHLSGV